MCIACSDCSMAWLFALLKDDTPLAGVARFVARADHLWQGDLPCGWGDLPCACGTCPSCLFRGGSAASHIPQRIHGNSCDCARCTHDLIE